MRIIAVTNIKGGVGKTTTSVNLAYLSAAGGDRTVLWDLDLQGAASWILRVDPAASAAAGALTSSDQLLAGVAMPTRYPNLYVIPADDPLRDLRPPQPEQRPTMRLLRMRRPLAEQCDTLIMDCPPGISLLSESVLRGADALIVPIVPTPLSVRMLDELVQYIATQQWPDLKLIPVFSMVDWRKSLHYEVVTAMRARFPQMLPMGIPYSSEIERVARRRAPLNAFAPNSDPAQLYKALWEEVQQRVPR
jgi:cellulose biosynthesis protein BcsQ